MTIKYKVILWAVNKDEFIENYATMQKVSICRVSQKMGKSFVVTEW
jgi:hypothetical protein